MPNEKDALIVLKRQARALRESGAHTIAVGPVRRDGKPTLGIIAYFRRRPKDLPQVLEATARGKKIRVPLSIRIADSPRPEIDI